MRLIDADSINFESNEFDTYNDYLTAFDTIDKAETIDPWHYPAKGELPEKDVECLVITKSGNKFIAMIDSSDNCWCTGEFFSEYLSDNCVACWQYIVLPKDVK